MDSLLKQLQEAEPVFKPASKKELVRRKEDAEKERKAKRAAGHEMCPNCGDDLHIEGVYSEENVVDCITRRYEWNEEKLKWDEVDTDRSGPEDGQWDNEKWFCSACGEEITEGEDFEINDSVSEQGEPVFKPASREELTQRISQEQDAQMKREAEEELKRREEQERVRIERARDPWKFDNTQVATRSRACSVCGGSIKKNERFFKVHYKGPYGRTHKAICKGCVAKALEKLN